MTIKKLCFLFLFAMGFGLAVFSSASVVEAKVLINEIMYDDEGADVDWVEVYNSGEEIDIASLKLLISNSTSNHSIKSFSGSSVLGTGEYGVIVANSQVASFVDRWGGGGNIFTASFSLPNVSGEQTAKVEINAGDKNNPLDSVTYEELLGAKGDGNSLQLIDGSWKSSVPTPREENAFNPGSSDLETSSSASDSEDESKKVSTAKPKITSKIFMKSVVFRGEPINFRAGILENGKEVPYRGKYYWNLGDGKSILEMNYPEKQKHVYYYPGDYSVSMKYYPDVFTENPQFETRMNIKAIPIQVSIKRAGISVGLANGIKDFGIELVNDSAYEIDVSAWSIIAGRKYFLFPQDSIILPKKSLTISGKLTGFVFGDENDLKLYSSTGEIISQYQP